MADNELISNEREVEEDEEEPLPVAREGDDDEDDDQDQEDGNDDDNNDDEDEERELNFGELCFLLLYDSPEFTEYKTPPLNNEKAVQLADSLRHNTHLKTLCVTMGPNLTTRGAQALGNGIQQSKIESLPLRVEDEGTILQADVASILFQKASQTVCSILLSFYLTEDDAAEMADALCSFNLLVNLSFNLPILSPNTARSLAHGIKGSYIKTIDIFGFTEMECSEEVMRTIYLDGIQNSQVDQIALYGNIGDIHDMVTVLPAIRTLIIAFVRLSVADMQLLVAGLRTSQQLDKLLLLAVPLTDEHIRIFTTEFLTHPTFTRKIEENHGTQCHLGLENDFIGPIAAQSLIQATLTFSVCKTLNLSHNTPIGYEGLRLIGEALPSSKLSELILTESVEWVEYDDDDDEELAEAQDWKCIEAADALVEGVRNNVHLQVLNVEGLHLPALAVEEIDFYLEMNRNFGRGLLSQQHTLHPSIWSFLLAKFSDELSVVFFYVRELPMLVPGGIAAKKGTKRLRRGDRDADE
jgi:hypothetical protein